MYVHKNGIAIFVIAAVMAVLLAASTGSFASGLIFLAVCIIAAYLLNKQLIKRDGIS